MGRNQRKRSAEHPHPIVPFEVCPIRASLGVLGRKWTLLLLRDVAFSAPVGFSVMLRRNPGITGRVLSRRLRELVKEGYVERVPDGSPEGPPRYHLTTKGKDVVPILMSYIRFGSMHHADEVYADRQSRTLAQLWPGAHRDPLDALSRFAKH